MASGSSGAAAFKTFTRQSTTGEDLEASAKCEANRETSPCARSPPGRRLSRPMRAQPANGCPVRELLRPMLELRAETAEGLPCYSVGARGLRTSHTWWHDGQKNVSVLKHSRVRTVRRATHIGQAGSRRTATEPIAVSRGDSSAGNTTPKTVRETEK
jgi:hypothetical protein